MSDVSEFWRRLTRPNVMVDDDERTRGRRTAGLGILVEFLSHVSSAGTTSVEAPCCGIQSAFCLCNKVLYLLNYNYTIAFVFLSIT